MNRKRKWIQTLLLPIDESEESTTPLPVAAALVETTGADIVLLHVTELPETPEQEEEARRVSNQRLDQVKQHLPGAVRTRVHETGDPVDGILKAVDDELADMVIMATHGRTGVAGFTEGSIAYDVVASGKVPVLLVPIGGEAS